MTFETVQQRTYAATVDAAARAAWEHDHPQDPWASAPESVRESMRGLVRPTVDTVLEHLRGLLYSPSRLRDGYRNPIGAWTVESDLRRSHPTPVGVPVDTIAGNVADIAGRAVDDVADLLGILPIDPVR